MSFPQHERVRLAILLLSLPLGGAERMMITLANGLARKGCEVDLVLVRRKGALVSEVARNVKLVELGTARPTAVIPLLLRLPWPTLRLVLPALLRHKLPAVARSLPRIVAYLQSAQPDALLTTLPNSNIVALWARWLSRTRTRLVLREANTTSKEIARSNHPFENRWPALMRQWYPHADAIVAVSDGVAADLSRLARLPRNRITTIFNAVDVNRIRELASAPITDGWFAEGAPPVLLAVGRLAPQKDYGTLLRAFALVRWHRSVRLVILGEGPERNRLQDEAIALGIAADVKMSGAVPNPFPYIARARLFVMSSAWEGLPNVLVEALACGCPIVSTDCLSGPREILEGGSFGELASVGDHTALAEAILRALASPADRPRLQARAQSFSVDRVAERYFDVLFDGHQSRADLRATASAATTGSDERLAPP
jgi:glycosyltransferase involved in cell wall biosynthesis